jgi:hypothetical protein
MPCTVRAHVEPAQGQIFRAQPVRPEVPLGVPAFHLTRDELIAGLASLRRYDQSMRSRMS